MKICATGHRKLHLNMDDAAKNGRDYLFNRLRDWLAERKGEVEACISGMALGFDTIWAEAALASQTPLWAYLPCEDQCKFWETKDRVRHAALLRDCSKVLYVSKEYHSKCMKWRNRRMVNDADLVFAYYGGLLFPGGTMQTCRYALQREKEVLNFYRDPEVKLKIVDVQREGYNDSVRTRGLHQI